MEFHLYILIELKYLILIADWFILTILSASSIVLHFKCQTLTKEINTVPDIYASVKEIHVHLQYAHLRLGFFESHVSHRIDHCFDVLKCFIIYVPIHTRGKILTFQIWRFMDNQSSLGGPLCCCEKLCVNEMLYFFCTHQLSSVLYNKHCFVATFVPCMNDSLIQITPPFFRIMIFFPDIFNLLKLLNNLMEFISIIFF